MADARMPTQQEVNDFMARPENKPGRLMGATLGAYRAIDNITGGSAGDLVSYATGVPREALDKITRAGEAQRPVAAGIGNVGMNALMAYGGARLAAPVIGAVTRAGSTAPWLAQRLGLDAPAAAKTTWQTAKSVAPTVGKILGYGTAGAVASNLMAPDEPAYVKREAEDAKLQADRDARNAGAAPVVTNPASAGGLSPEDYWSAYTGLRPQDVRALAKQEGGLPLYALEKLTGMKPRAPGYKDVAFSALMNGLQNRLVAMEKAGASPEDMALYQKQVDTLLAGILGQDPLGQLVVPQE